MKYLCTLLVSLLFCVAGMAQQVDSAAIIQTSDGETYTGKIVKYEEGKSVTIVQNGRGYILDWSMIKSIKSAAYNVGAPTATAKDTTLRKELSPKIKVIRKSREVSNFYYRKPHYFLGFNAGWGAPYGLGGEFSVLFKGYVDINVGFGVDMGGFRGGGGMRVFIVGRRKFNPLIAATVVYNSGFSYTSTQYGQQVKNDVWAGLALHLKGGLRINTTRASVLLNAGYGIRLAHYGSGRSTSFPPITDAHSTFGAGGIEVSIDVLFRIKSKYYSFKEL